MSASLHGSAGLMNLARRGVVREVFLPWRTRPAVQRADCATPECMEAPMDGSRFCPGHVCRFAQIAAELQAELDEKGTAGRRSDQRTHVSRQNWGPTCCNSDCVQPRVPPDRYCDACIDVGWVEESA